MTAIEEVLFDCDRFESTSELFPEFISSDHWIAYHGTSSVYEGEIERSGLRPSNHVADKKEIQEVVSVYEKMNWYGDHVGGLPVLKPFTLEHDLADPRGKPVYFAESSRRASLYAVCHEGFFRWRMCASIEVCTGRSSKIPRITCCERKP